jgi:peptidoglycan/xylan/chitin deacetylase (PgdA/CDA1 family)
LRATLFLATGLTENPGYITWAQVNEIKDRVDVANHTWSHQNMKTSREVIEREIGTADSQLSEKGLNPNKAFAFPYGTMSGAADTSLAKFGYKLAYDTLPGRIQCKQKRFALTRIRVGNAKLSAYGL